LEGFEEGDEFFLAAGEVGGAGRPLERDRWDLVWVDVDSGVTYVIVVAAGDVTAGRVDVASDKGSASGAGWRWAFVVGHPAAAWTGIACYDNTDVEFIKGARVDSPRYGVGKAGGEVLRIIGKSF
jgi:hypothetical protein